jgi:hypothetical protein
MSAETQAKNSGAETAPTTTPAQETATPRIKPHGGRLGRPLRTHLM